MLHLKKVLGAKPKEHVKSELAVLYTEWGEGLDPQHVLEEHPTPQFARPAYRMLNGEWKCAFVENAYDIGSTLENVVAKATAPDAIDTPIIVPFSPEAPLSGVNRQLKPGELLWYRTTFELVPEELGERLLLHFQAVDYACSVRVNGAAVASHEGGYIPFVIDITENARVGANTLEVCVADPSEQGAYVRGKQRLDRGDIWYTAQSGIWQSVWLERVPFSYVKSAVLQPDPDTGILAVGLRLNVDEAAPAAQATVNVYDVWSVSAEPIATATCEPEQLCALALHIEDPHLWSPDDPFLYRVSIRYGEDDVESYCGFRKIELREAAAGRKQVFLNGERIFIKGVLDQAYWSDGLMTAPADAALVHDIRSMRACGFNLMRKHIKVEAERWYYHCDRLGMLVLQDMVSGGGPDINLWHWSYKPTLFKVSWRHYRDDVKRHWKNLGADDSRYREAWTKACHETVQGLANHPSIIGWSLFNEGWGQFESTRGFNEVRALDPTRLIDAVSGWYDQGAGDFHSVHNYFRDFRVWRDSRAKRAFFVSEFGGFTHRVDGHSSLDEAYGYEPYDDRIEWCDAFLNLLNEVGGMEEQGLAGLVYTQVSDIEEETNGILTYDRRVNKLAGA